VVPSQLDSLLHDIAEAYSDAELVEESDTTGQNGQLVVPATSDSPEMSLPRVRRSSGQLSDRLLLSSDHVRSASSAIISEARRFARLV
jgi:hypothetical protein